MSGEAIVVIDMQQALVEGAYRQNALVDAVNSLIDRGRRSGVPVIFVQHNHATFEAMKRGAPGWEIFAGLDRQPQDVIVEKEASDAFYRTDLEERLKAMDIDHLVVTGLQTEYCVDTTCRAALSRDFDVTLVADGHSTGDARMSAADIVAHHNTLLANVVHPRSRIRVVNASDVIFGASR